MQTLIGAGGHAKVVYEIAKQNDVLFNGFIDPNVINFFDLQKLNDNLIDQNFFIGIGGVTVAQLQKRYEVYKNYIMQKLNALTLISKYAYVSPFSKIGTGTLVAHNVTVQINAMVGENTIINTGAIIEHDVSIADGVHIAPGAVVLGNARIGACAMIGSGAIILPEQEVPANTLVPALTRFKNER
jgi:sugar O-acyltransferase (sialic acid O-acetyltransferase NeuD family)